MAETNEYLIADLSKTSHHIEKDPLITSPTKSPFDQFLDSTLDFHDGHSKDSLLEHLKNDYDHTLTDADIENLKAIEILENFMRETFPPLDLRFSSIIKIIYLINVVDDLIIIPLSYCYYY